MSVNVRNYVEIIGITVVVASLIAVVFELRQTQSALIASTFQARAFDAIAEEHYVSESELLLPILVNTNYGENNTAVTNLNEFDRARLIHFLRARMIDFDNEFYQYQNGFLRRDFFEGTTSRLVKEWAPRWRAIGLKEGRRDFEELVNRLLEEE